MPMLHKHAFEYLSPTPEQMEHMKMARDAVGRYSDLLEAVVPEGPDKTYLQRKLREVAMWVNVAITREANGAPRA